MYNRIILTLDEEAITRRALALAQQTWNRYAHWASSAH
jgi:hypothetical protein